MHPNPYQVLQLPTPPINASYSQSDIRKAYRKRALALHPDKNPNDENASLKFNELNSVFEWLLTDANRNSLDQQLWAVERGRIKLRSLDEEKRRLAEDLKRREKLHAQGVAGAKEGEHALKQQFRPASPTPQVSEEAKRKAAQAVYNREYLEILRKSRSGKPKSEAPPSRSSEVDSDSVYVVNLSWNPTELNMETADRARNVLEVLLRAYKPWQMLQCTAGHAQIKFLSQAKAVSAAMSLTLQEEVDSGFRRTGLRPDIFFSARVIKKPRVAKQLNVIDSDDDWTEEELQEALRERKRREEMQRARAADPYLSEDEDPPPPASAEPSPSAIPTGYRVPSSSAPPPMGRINATLLNRLNLPTVNEKRPIQIDSDDDLENETMAMLREAAKHKKSKYA